MGKLKKGIFYTIGFFLLTGIILSLSVLTFKNSNFSQDRFNEIIVLDRVYETEVSMAEGFRDIIRIKSGLSANIIGTSIKFTDMLPNNNKNEFEQELEKYKLFLENNFSVIVDVNSLKTNMALTVKPHEIKYYHEDFGDNIIKVEAENPNFEGYILSINTIEDLNENSCVASGSGQDVYMEVYATGTTGSCSSPSHLKSTFALYNSESELIVTMTVSGDDLTVTSSKQINISTTLDALDNLGGLSVTLPKELLYVNFTEFGISKNSTIILV